MPCGLLPWQMYPTSSILLQSLSDLFSMCPLTQRIAVEPRFGSASIEAEALKVLGNLVTRYTEPALTEKNVETWVPIVYMRLFHVDSK